jgi:hypothetical protein
MTPLEQAKRDAAHARDELQIATMLLARVRGQFEADLVMKVAGCELPARREAYHAICKFMRRTSLYPKQEA